MATHLTPEDRQHILRRYQEGASLRGIGREIGRPAITVQRTLEAAGVDLGPKKTSNKRSSPETEALVLRLYDERCTWKAICEQAGITSVTLGKILQRNGRDHDRRSDAEANAEAIAELYEAGHSTRSIGEILGHGKSTVNALIARHGGELRQRPGCERPDYFEQVDTPEKAYWLGFIAADGCIITNAKYPEGSHLAVQLAICDKGHLVKLKEALGAHAAVVTGTQQRESGPRQWAALAVGSRRLTLSLLALGIGPRKSATVEPWDGPPELMPHYWRGLFDGDGSIARKTSDQHQMILCGSEACVRGFAAWSAGICGTGAEPFYRGGCWRYGVSGRYQVPKLVRALYADAPVSLDRKQEIADAILASEQPRRKPGPPRMEFSSEEEREEHFREQRRAAQRRYQDKKRTAAAQAAT